MKNLLFLFISFILPMEAFTQEQKIDKNSPIYSEMYLEVSEDSTELAFPPKSEYVISSEIVADDYVSKSSSTGCDKKVKVTEEGNPTYAWFYLTNSSSKYANVTIEKKWKYKGEWRTETARHRLYPGQKKNVFNFPKRQNPSCGITDCSLE